LKEEQEKKKALAEVRKKKQKEHYAQQVQGKTPSKKVKQTPAKETPIEAKETAAAFEEVQETGLYKRFIKWLNT